MSRPERRVIDAQIPRELPLDSVVRNGPTVWTRIGNEPPNRSRWIAAIGPGSTLCCTWPELVAKGPLTVLWEP